MTKNIPAHIGIILDGNGRWAKKRGLPRLKGHEKGAEAVRRTIIAASEIGVKAISLFAFSTENWKRSKEEVDGIFKILENFLRKNEREIKEKNFKLQIMGEIGPLNDSIKEQIQKLVDSTKDNTGLIVNMGLNYGGRAEIIRAINLILEEKRDKINEEEFEKYLYTNGLPPLDFVIRTSGENRISNFMLYQIAYAEFYFPKTYWPSFNKKYLIKAIKVYQKRNRRFGKV
jgi:undecaprenyl diphosphate synthase